jgi:hypothetical protein
MINVATLSAGLVLSGFALPEAAFEAQVIDDKITVGYGLAVADLDGDGKVDILLADSDRTVAYRGPNWEMRELTGETDEERSCLPLCEGFGWRQQGGDCGGRGMESGRYQNEWRRVLAQWVGGLFCEARCNGIAS